jgi:hypothetical protein
MSPPLKLPLIVLTGLQSVSLACLATVLVDRSRLGVELVVNQKLPTFAVFNTRWYVTPIKSSPHPLMPFVSRSEFESIRLARYALESTNRPAFMRTALPWDFLLYDASRYEQRPTPSLPGPTVLRLQVFSTS